MGYLVDMGDHTEKATENGLRHMFMTMINHGWDGWATYEDWLADMKRNHLIKEVA